MKCEPNSPKMGRAKSTMMFTVYLGDSSEGRFRRHFLFGGSHEYRRLVTGMPASMSASSQAIIVTSDEVLIEFLTFFLKILGLESASPQP